MRKVLLVTAAVVVIEILLVAEIVARSGVIGLVLLELVTAAVGLWAIKRHAPRVLEGWQGGSWARAAVDNGSWHAGLGLLGGVLLVLPGVLTDMAGLLLMVPPVRALVVPMVRSRASEITRSASRLGSTLFRWTGWGKHPADKPNGKGKVIDIDGRSRDEDDGPKRRR